MLCKKCNHPETSHAPLLHGVNSCQDCAAGIADHVFVPQACLPRLEDPCSEPSLGWIATVKCACGWEAMYILPEDCFRYLIGVLGHARDAHGTVIPEIEHRTL